MTPTISSQAVRKLLDAAPELGASPAELCARTGFDPRVCEDKDARVPVAALHALWEACLERYSRGDAVLRVVQHYAPGDYGLVGFVCMSSATLREGLSQAVRYLALWSDEPAIALDQGDVLVSYRAPLADRPGLRCETESTLCELLHGARELLGEQLAPLEVRFAHPGPADRQPWDAFFRSPVQFGARGPAARMRFSTAQLETKLPGADPQLGAFLEDLAARALAQRQTKDPLVTRVREHIAAALQRGAVGAGPTARRLAMSERTLRRRLEERGTSFREVLQQAREDLARRYVQDREVPLSEVAFLLGFSEPSAFHRAFRRWTGVTPAAFRVAAHAAPKTPADRADR